MGEEAGHIGSREVSEQRSMIKACCGKIDLVALQPGLSKENPAGSHLAPLDSCGSLLMSWCRVAKVLQAGYLFVYSYCHPF